MATFKYVGPHDVVDVSMPDGSHQRVEQGETIQVEASDAAGFNSDAWQAVKASKEVKDNG